MSTIRTKGISFPLTLTSGAHTLVEGSDLIKDSIRCILAWPLFTSEYEDNFGSRVFELLEEPNDDILITLLRRFVRDALSEWENRIELLGMEIYRPSSEKLSIDLIYRIKEFDIQDSLQHYFYINQGI